MDKRTRVLFEVNVDDILAALGWRRGSVGRRFVRGVARWPALHFAREMTAFDDQVAASGIRSAATALLSSFVRDVRVCGADQIPTRGPLLLLSNHPGMTDTLVLLATIPRPDLRVLAAERPFLRALPAVSRSCIFIPEEENRRMTAIREAVTHLRSGGALLTFPAGEIEPDPAVQPGAVASLSRWSQSTAVFLRLVPDCTVVPLVVSGVLARRAQHQPLTLLRRKGPDRERLAAMLQVLMHTLLPAAWPVRVRIDIPRAFRGVERAALMDSVAAALRFRERA